MFTVDQIAKLLGTDSTTAYGLVRFLEAKGVLQTTRAKTGMRGKPHNLYTFASPVPHVDVSLSLLPFFEAVAMYNEERQAEAAAALAKRQADAEVALAKLQASVVGPATSVISVPV